jgi:hypothetical protein
MGPMEAVTKEDVAVASMYGYRDFIVSRPFFDVGMPKLLHDRTEVLDPAASEGASFGARGMKWGNTSDALSR